MILWNKEKIAIYARDVWFNQYGHREDLLKEILAVRKLGANPTMEQLTKASGGRINWDVPYCKECGEDKDEVVELGDDPNKEPHGWTTHVCAECLLKAMILINP